MPVITTTRNAPQILPLTLVVGHMGKILFTHSGRSQTDLPEDCAAIREIVARLVDKGATAPRNQHGSDALTPHCSDETTSTLPRSGGIWDFPDLHLPSATSANGCCTFSVQQPFLFILPPVPR